MKAEIIAACYVAEKYKNTGLLGCKVVVLGVWKFPVTYRSPAGHLPVACRSPIGHLPASSDSKMKATDWF